MKRAPTSGSFQPGNPGGPGRIKGMKNLSTILFDQVMEKYQSKLTDGTFVSPLSFYLDILNDEEEVMEVREKAASQLMKYFHSSMPTEIQQTVNDVSKAIKIQFIADLPPTDVTE